MTSMAESLRPVAVCCLARADDAPPPEPVFVFDTEPLPADPATLLGVVLPTEGLPRARELLERGVPRVLLGEAALLDSGAVGKLASEFGAGRVGLYVPAVRMQVSWSMDVTSNADFKIMRPSVCEPCWEVLRGDGARSGASAAWWIGEMQERGVTTVMVRTDIRDDCDLNLCAALVEQCGDRLWIGPLEDDRPVLADWIEYGRAGRLVVPRALYDTHREVLALRGLPAPDEQLVEIT